MIEDSKKTGLVIHDEIDWLFSSYPKDVGVILTIVLKQKSSTK